MTETQGDDAKLAERLENLLKLDSRRSKGPWWTDHEGHTAEDAHHTLYADTGKSIAGTENADEREMVFEEDGWHDSQGGDNLYFIEALENIWTEHKEQFIAALRHPHQPQGGEPSETQGEELAGRLERLATLIDDDCSRRDQRFVSWSQATVGDVLDAIDALRHPHQRDVVASEVNGYRAGLERAIQYHEQSARECDLIADANDDNELGPDSRTRAADHRVDILALRELAALPSPQAAGVGELITELREQAQGFCKATAGTMLATSGPPKIVMLLNKAADALAALTPLPAGGLSERDRLADLVSQMIHEQPWDHHPHARVALSIASKAVRRGRHLTATEKLENLAKSLEEDGTDEGKEAAASLRDRLSKSQGRDDAAQRSPMKKGE